MNEHLFKKLKRLYDNRHTVNGRDDYYRGLVSSKVTESALIEEIANRLKDGK